MEIGRPLVSDSLSVWGSIDKSTLNGENDNTPHTFMFFTWVDMTSHLIGYCSWVIIYTVQGDGKFESLGPTNLWVGKKGFNGCKHHAISWQYDWNQRYILLMGQILAVSWGPQLIKPIKCFCFLAFLLSLGNEGEMVKEKSRMTMKGIQYNHKS